MTYVLHYAPDNASLIIRIALEELGQSYRTQLVDRSAGAQFSAAHRALNPAGRIPVLETPEGPVFETAAILLWLADRHDALIPSPDQSTRGHCLTWLMFMSNDVQSLMRLHFYTDRYVPEGSVQPLRSGLEQAFLKSFSLLEEAAEEDGYFASSEPSILDCYLGPLLRWAVLYPMGQTPWFRLDAFPKLKRIAKLLEARPSMQRLTEAEGLGPRPFTDVRPANPPEGVAL